MLENNRIEFINELRTGFWDRKLTAKIVGINVKNVPGSFSLEEGYTKK